MDMEMTDSVGAKFSYLHIVVAIIIFMLIRHCSFNTTVDKMILLANSMFR